jgi:voltage-dependent potassium channel beta subunit
MSKPTHNMEYRFLGKSGLKVSVLSIGTWITFGTQIDEDKAVELFKAAFDNGCNFIDCAEGYNAGKAEEITGAALKRLGYDRSEFVISTKIFFGGSGHNQTGLSRKHIIEGTNKSLKRLGLDYVDLLFCHRPDFYTPLEETVRAMNFLIDQGKALYWGTSEWSAEQISRATEIANRLHLIPPLMEQPQYNLLCRNRFEVEYKPLFEEFGYGTTIWSPLASGLLTGKYVTREDLDQEGSRFSLSDIKWLRNQFESGEGLNGLDYKDPEKVLETVAKLKPVAQRLGCSLPQLAIAWTLKNKNVSTCILGASKVEQIHENFKALDVYRKLTDQDMKELDDIVGKPKQPKDWRYAH